MAKKEIKKEEVKKVESRLTPRVTEKASFLQEKNVYTFNISDKTNKTELGKEIFKLYKVKPVKINILSIKKKNTMFKGQYSTRGGGRKAVVYLKKGDKIEV